MADPKMTPLDLQGQTSAWAVRDLLLPRGYPIVYQDSQLLVEMHSVMWCPSQPQLLPQIRLLMRLRYGTQRLELTPEIYTYVLQQWRQNTQRRYESPWVFCPVPFEVTDLLAGRVR